MVKGCRKKTEEKRGGGREEKKDGKKQNLNYKPQNDSSPRQRYLIL